MPIRQLIPSFNAGEISPYLNARSDIEKYVSGCRILENMIATPYGGVIRRPGTEWVKAAKNSSKRCRLIEFNYSATTRFMLEFGEQYIRFYYGGTDAQNAMIENPSSPGTAYEVATPYLESELRDLQYVQINDVAYFDHPSYPPYKLSRLADNQWTFEEIAPAWPALLDENVTDVTITASATSGSGITLTASAPAWVTLTAYVKNQYVSNGGSIYKASLDHTSGVTFATDLAAGKWALYSQFSTASVGSYYQLGHTRTSARISQAISSNVSSSSITVLGTWEFTTYGTWKATVAIERSRDGGANFEVVRSYISESDRNVSSTGTEETECLLRITVSNYTSNTNGRAQLELQDAREYGFAKITGYTSATVVTADVKNAFYANTATKTWSEGAWSAVQGYPRAVALHEQRIYHGGTAKRPQSLWGSNSDDFENFRVSTNDDAGLFFSLSSQQANPIQWLVSQDQLLIGTAGDEWTIGSSSSDEPITPSNVRAARQSSYGSKYMRAIGANDVILFPQRQGRKLRELVYVNGVDKQGWVAPDLTVLAEHVTKGEILEAAFQQQPDSLYWAVTGEGQLIGMTYERDQNVVGWHRHTTDGEFESVATIYGASGPDEVWLSVKRTINGSTVRYIERFKVDFREQFEAENKSGWWYLDCAKRYSGSSTATITGLSHLEGKTVDILADGAVSPSRTVSSAQITLQEAASTVLAGLPYISTLRPMNLEMQLRNGSTTGAKKRISRASVAFYKSLGGQYQANSTDIWDNIFSRGMTDPMDSSPPAITETLEFPVSGNHTRDVSITLRQTQPLPFAVLAITPLWEPTGN